MRHVVLLCSLVAAAFASELSDVSRNAAQLRSTLKADDLTKGLAFLGDHEEMLFAIETNKTPSLVTDDDAPVAMSRIDGNLWTAVVKLKAGRSHQFHYVIDGAAFGGRLDVPVFLPESYE